MADPKPSKLERLKERQKQLAAQIAAAESRERSEERKVDTRRKVLIGGAVLESLRRGEYSQDRLAALLDKALKHERDRALFDFLPAAEPDTQS